MQYRVLTVLPKGQQPGDLVELNEDEARVLLLVGAVEAIPDQDRPKGRRYARRDLQATED